VFASGSPFAPVTVNGRTLVAGQGNNAYVFPGVGLGIVSSGAKRVTNSMLNMVARTLAGLVKEEELAEGRVYPSLRRIQEVSLAIAVAVAEVAFANNLNTHSRPGDLPRFIRSHMFQPEYPDYTKK